MKKYVFALCCPLFMGTGLYAQDTVADTTSTGKVVPESGVEDEAAARAAGKYQANGGSLEYLAVDHGFGLGINFAFANYAVFDFFYSSASAHKVDSDSWGLDLGGHYRYWLGKWFYLEGNLGLMYGHSKVEYTSTSSGSSSYYSRPIAWDIDRHSGSSAKREKESDGGFGLFVTPRVGVRLFSSGSGAWGIVAGYRWNFSDFKFDKAHTADYFTVGITYTM